MSDFSARTVPAVPLPAGAVSASTEWFLDSQNRTLRHWFGHDCGETVIVSLWGTQAIDGALVGEPAEQGAH